MFPVKARKRAAATVLAAALLLVCSPLPAAHAREGGGYVISPKVSESSKARSEWTICVYMCGSDLESRDSLATADLLQMIEADIPETATVLAMTGGSRQWDPRGLAKRAVEEGRVEEGSYMTPDSRHPQIFEVDDGGMKLLHTYEKNLPMNDMATAAAFLEFALGYAPSEKLMVIFWDHGGGPIGGTLLDEYARSATPMTDIAALVSAASGAWGKKIDLIGFDACISSNLETANLLSPYADYLVASEEVEPGGGWNYLWLNEATGGPQDLGRAIVDAYASTTEDGGTWADANGLTLALTDLSRIPALMDAFSAMAEELTGKLGDSGSYAAVARRAERVQAMSFGKYGLLDLYDFARSMLDVLPSAQAVIDALGTPPGETPEHFVGRTLGNSPAVVYRGVGGDYSECIGLAFYYPTMATGFEGEEDIQDASARYSSLGLPQVYTGYVDALIQKDEALKTFHGELSLGYNTQANCPTLTIRNPEDALAIKSVLLDLNYIQKQPGGGEKAYHLGSLPAQADWDAAHFEAPIPDQWFSVNGQPCTITDLSTPWYEEYAIPVLVGDNGHISTMAVSRLPGEESYTMEYILDPGENDMASRVFLPEGEFTFRGVLLSENDETDYLASPPCTLSPDEGGGYRLPAQTVPLAYGPDALYQARFIAVDMQGEEHESSYLLLGNADSLNDLTIKPIQPQIYTGRAVTPALGYLYGESEVSQLGGNFDIVYTNNVEPGLATVTVTSLEPDFPGQISAQFEIKPLGEIFGDVSYDDWFFPNMNFMYSHGYMGGTGVGFFSPSGILTRSMAVAILYRSSSQTGRSEKEFADVSQEAYYYSAVQWAVENGIVSGYDDGSRFGPDDPITREQLMTILYRYGRSQSGFQPPEETALPYADAETVSPFALEAVGWMTTNGVVTGYADNTLRPQNGVSRMEACAIFARLLQFSGQ